ncbi:uncharacterized protein RCC_04162 [Ramularia collo-cygni]|uniref:Uncharacterized protein n=1 Tax=Ramularia collo-cygni TaxID=112498 RepID=A0A2D3UTJ9_9PEZI|nr:uncharacterized protein RCC_04162 [Ramularia collo-cygni]CZT18318.1 uncharacterized protein RCC_04162 [Ramularia collo-cygni]
MRDRRNTILSASSTASSDPPASPPSIRVIPDDKKLFSSPPPSPLLPAPVTSDRRIKASLRRSMAVKGLIVACGMVGLYVYVLQGLMYPVPSATANFGKSIDIVAGNPLPGEPTALVVVDSAARSQWTVWIPHNQTFPLSSQIYADMCKQGNQLKSSIETSTLSSGKQPWWRKQGYYAKDRTFLDITDAERTGVLPKSRSMENVCETSLTFVLGAEDASFGKSLLLLWMSYGLAKKEGRAFFYDDSHWAWGKYISYFAPPPSPKCVRPPTHHIVPCPHTARHIVVSTATAPFTFGETFDREFRDARKHGLASQSRIFDLIRSGYNDLFVLTGEDALYAQSRVAKLKDEAGTSRMLAAQIRRGDNHPSEFQYQYSYLPLERYLDGARLLSSKLSPGALSGSKTQLLVASDDPNILTSPELQQADSESFTIHRAQERIQLATKDVLDQSSPVQSLRKSGSAYVKHVEENSGWEGGFYSALFYSLGGASENNVPEQAMLLRRLVGRAYVLDLAVLGESDGVVCASSSAGCRLLAVAMGWDAVKAGRWMNVDDGRVWTWNGQR